MTEYQPTALDELTWQTDREVKTAIEALRDDLASLDLVLQRSMSACTATLVGGEFTLSTLGVVQGAGQKIDTACAVIHELVQRQKHLRRLTEGK